MGGNELPIECIGEVVTFLVTALLGVILRKKEKTSLRKQGKLKD